MKQEDIVEKKRLQAEKREKVLDRELVEALHKLFEAEARVLTVAQARVEHYKKTKGFHNEKVMYGVASFLLGKHDV